MFKKFVIRVFILILAMLLLSACSALSPTQVSQGDVVIPVTGQQAAPALEIITTPPTFNDVSYDYAETVNGVVYNLHDPIQALYDNGLTTGTSANPPLYNPATIIDRAHFAVFLLRAEFGRDYAPPAEPWSTFAADDWTALADYQKWAEGMYKAQLTNGCQADPLMFCPTQQLTRLDAVVFALRIKFNIYDEAGNLAVAYEPPTASGTVFADMTDSNFYGTRWAEAAYATNLLPACGYSGDKPMFCPNEVVNRAWAAYIISQARGLVTP